MNILYFQNKDKTKKQKNDNIECDGRKNGTKLTLKKSWCQKSINQA